MKDQQGHNYFFPMPAMPWKESKMAIRDQEVDDFIRVTLPDILERLGKVESALALLEEQEEEADAIHDETA